MHLWSQARIHSALPRNLTGSFLHSRSGNNLPSFLPNSSLCAQTPSVLLHQTYKPTSIHTHLLCVAGYMESMLLLLAKASPSSQALDSSGHHPQAQESHPSHYLPSHIISQPLPLHRIITNGTRPILFRLTLNTHAFSTPHVPPAGDSFSTALVIYAKLPTLHCRYRLPEGLVQMHIATQRARSAAQGSALPAAPAAAGHRCPPAEGPASPSLTASNLLPPPA